MRLPSFGEAVAFVAGSSADDTRMVVSKPWPGHETKMVAALCVGAFGDNTVLVRNGVSIVAVSLSAQALVALRDAAQAALDAREMS